MRAEIFLLGKEQSAIRLEMTLRNSRQECLKECLKGNQSYLFIGLFELE